jgi:hypothetical protein
MIPALLTLRAALDQAIAALEPLAPVLTAWAETAPAEAAGDATAPSRPAAAANGAVVPGGPPGRFAPDVRGQRSEAACPECGRSFARVGRQVYCGPRCRGRAGERRRRAERQHEAAVEPVPDLIARPLFVPGPEGSSDLAALKPPSLPWDRRP